MDPIRRNDSGAAVLDVQRRLVTAGYLAEEAITGTFDAKTADAVAQLCVACGIDPRQEVDELVWNKLVDESFELGDRNLFLRVPFFHGRDVRTLQEALSALGFSCGEKDGIFGAHTEDAVRRFQLNMGLPSDGIVGAFTFRALNHLQQCRISVLHAQQMFWSRRLFVFMESMNLLVQLLLVCPILPLQQIPLQR